MKWLENPLKFKKLEEIPLNFFKYWENYFRNGVGKPLHVKKNCWRNC